MVWLFIAYDLDDIQNANWVCRTCWIDPSLPEDVRPLDLRENEKHGDIKILWNDEYKSYKNIFEGFYGTKEEVLETNKRILNEMVELAKKAIEYFEEYRKDKIPEEEFILKMREMEPRVNELYHQSVNIPMSSTKDCEDYDQACQYIFGTIQDMFLYYSKRGLEIWPKKNRDWLIQDAIKRYCSDLERIKFEESKLH